jgi:hypothetical protein
MCAAGGPRTPDPPVKSRPLCQLSYDGECFAIEPCVFFRASSSIPFVGEVGIEPTESETTALQAAWLPRARLARDASSPETPKAAGVSPRRPSLNQKLLA